MTVYHGNVTLEPGQSKPITFEVVPSSEGTYHVSLNGLSGSFVVLKHNIQIDASIGISMLDSQDNVLADLIRGESYKVRLMVNNRSRDLSLDPSYDWVAATFNIIFRVSLNSVGLYSWPELKNFGPGESIPSNIIISLPEIEEGTLLVDVWVKSTDGTIIATGSKSYPVTQPVIEDYLGFLGGLQPFTHYAIHTLDSVWCDMTSLHGYAGIPIKLMAFDSQGRQLSIVPWKPDNQAPEGSCRVQGLGSGVFQSIMPRTRKDDNSDWYAFIHNTCYVQDPEGNCLSADDFERLDAYLQTPEGEWVLVQSVSAYHPD